MTSTNENSEASESNRRVASSVGLLIVGSSLALHAYFLIQSKPLQSANDRSRWCTVWSLVERGTYAIDEIDQRPQWSTIDKVRHSNSEDEGYHFYSSKPPLFPTCVAGLYWVGKSAFGLDLLERTKFTTSVLLFLLNIVPWAFALLSLRKTLRLLNVEFSVEWLVLIAAGFGSMLGPYLTTLNNHTPAAISLVFCLSGLVRIWLGSTRPVDFAIVGFTAALTCCFELPAASFGLLSFFLVLRFGVGRTTKWYVPAAVIPLGLFFLTNWICTGGIKPFYTYYGTEKYRYIHEGIPSYWFDPKGIDANTESPFVYLFHCLIGHHGIFSLSPIYFFTIAGWMFASTSKVQNRLRWIGIGLSLLILTFYLTRTQNYNYGGNSAALRWMLWLTPLWWFGMIPALRGVSKNRMAQGLVAIAIVWSVCSSFWSLTTPWKPNWIFAQMQSAGWIDYRTKTPPFAPPRSGLLAKIESSQVATWVRQDESKTSITLESRNGQDGFVALSLKVAEGGSAETFELSADVVSFRKGEDIEEWAAASIGEERVPRRVIQMLRGLAAPKRFNAESPRYVKYTRADGEKWAIKCLRGAARVKVNHPKFGSCWQRTDVLYSDDVPFGLVGWTTTLSDVTSGKKLQSHRWLCRDFPE